MPIAAFDGEVIVVDHTEQVADAIAYLRTQHVLGVDTESRPSFTRNVHYPTALVQIASHERCYLFRLTHIGMPQELADLFADPGICKVGLAFRDDINGLRRRRDFTPANCIDIQKIVGNYGILDLGLQKIFAICFGKKISKSQQLTNWENSHLTPEQARYASTDAWATLLIYEDLLRHEPLSRTEVETLMRQEKEQMIEHQQEVQDQRLREQGIEPPPHLTPEERAERKAQKKREARKRKRINKKHKNTMQRISLSTLLLLIAIMVSAQAKYVFYFIGDGMGSNQVLSAEMYQSAIQGEPLGRTQTLMTTFPYSGHASTYSKSNGITDSAAAGTCLATGQKTTNGALGVGKDSTHLSSIAEELKAQGWGVGIMTTVAIDHATPAAFYAHVPKRNQYYEIGKQLSESNFDFFGGAGFHYPQGKKDDKDVNLYRLAEERGYTIAHGLEEAEIKSHTKEVDKLILVQKDDDQGKKHGDNLPYAIDRKENDLTLKQIVSTAIPFLSARYDQFFMMIEGGMIDYACHSDDAAPAIGEVWDMNDAMRVVYEFYKTHAEETLIIVTADHETGGMALGNSDYTLRLDLLQQQKCSSWVLSDLFAQLFENKKKPSWEEVKQLYREQLGFWNTVEISKSEEKDLKALYKTVCSKKSHDTETMYKTINKLGDAGIALLNTKAHIGWTTHAHSAHAVPIFAIGAGAERFTGWHDNSEIVPIIREITVK